MTETADILDKPPSSWQPEQDKVTLAHLGKLGEETAELSGIISRCIIQGIDACDPETGKPNRQALMEEIADVYALAGLAIMHFNLNTPELARRIDAKQQYQQAWHEMLREQIT